MEIAHSYSFQEPMFCQELIENGEGNQFSILCSSMSNKAPNFFRCVNFPYDRNYSQSESSQSSATSLSQNSSLPSFPPYSTQTTRPDHFSHFVNPNVSGSLVGNPIISPSRLTFSPPSANPIISVPSTNATILSTPTKTTQETISNSQRNPPHLLFENEVKFPITDIHTIPSLSTMGDSTYFFTTSDCLGIWSVDSLFSETNAESCEKSGSAETAENKEESNEESKSNEVNIKCKQEVKHIDSIYLNKINCPLTSGDSNDSTLLVSSTDCTVCLIDLYTLNVKTRLLAHDHPIYDVCSCGDNSSTFLTCGFDGSVREFDSRNISSLSVIYQSPKPVLRISVSPSNSNIVSLFSLNSENVTVIDRRNTTTPLCVTRDNGAYITSMSWSTNGDSLYFGTEHGQLMFTNFPTGSVLLEPVLLYHTTYPIESISVSDSFISLCSNKALTVLHK